MSQRHCTKPPSQPNSNRQQGAIPHHAASTLGNCSIVTRYHSRHDCTSHMSQLEASTGTNLPTHTRHETARQTGASPTLHAGSRVWLPGPLSRGLLTPTRHNTRLQLQSMRSSTPRQVHSQTCNNTTTPGRNLEDNHRWNMPTPTISTSGFSPKHVQQQCLAKATPWHATHTSIHLCHTSTPWQLVTQVLLR